MKCGPVSSEIGNIPITHLTSVHAMFILDRHEGSYWHDNIHTEGFNSDNDLQHENDHENNTDFLPLEC